MMLQMKLCGDPVLREVAAPVTEITRELRAVMDEMVGMMEEQNGAGLAAPQVGISQRFLVMKDLKKQKEPGEVLRMLNPVIVAKSMQTAVLEEGCLSVLGPRGPVFADVERPAAVVVRFTDENGRAQEREFNGFAARIVQHEIDHLDGILFLDYLSSAKREMVMNKVKKAKK